MFMQLNNIKECSGMLPRIVKRFVNCISVPNILLSFPFSVKLILIS